MSDADHIPPLTLILAAVEPSGDALGAALIQSLRRKHNNLQLLGCGGSLMEQEEFTSAFSIAPLSVMGFTDVARALPEASKRVKQLAIMAHETGADAVIFIDGWAFSRLGAKKVRALSPNTKIYKLAAPQIWASRPQRIQFVQNYFDGVLTLLPFEPTLFEAAGVPSTFIGNPVFQQARQYPVHRDAFRKRYRIGDAPLLAVLPGSRASELSRLAEPFEQTIIRLQSQLPDLRIVIPTAPAIAQQVRARCSGWPNSVIIDHEEKYTAFSAADAALAASGTVTTELAIHRTPMVLAYKVDWVTALWARRVLKTNYASILNYMADEMLIPEFIQNACNPDDMAASLYQLLTDQKAAEAQTQALAPLLQQLALDGPPASDRAADMIFSWLANAGQGV